MKHIQWTKLQKWRNVSYLFSSSFEWFYSCGAASKITIIYRWFRFWIKFYETSKHFSWNPIILLNRNKRIIQFENVFEESNSTADLNNIRWFFVKHKRENGAIIRNWTAKITLSEVFPSHGIRSSLNFPC